MEVITRLPTITVTLTTIITLSDVVNRMLTVTVPCSDCNATGREYGLFWDRWESQGVEGSRPCSTCHGEKTTDVELCILCGQNEDGCDRNCKRTVCCQKHPANCECDHGVMLYEQTYGLPLAAHNLISGMSTSGLIGKQP